MTFLGLDVGTSAARAMVVDPQGRVLARATETLPSRETNLPPGWAEQDAQDWWAAAVRCLRQVTAITEPGSIRALAVTSTSGTFVPVDAKGHPLRPALMYHDGRAAEEAAQVSAAGRTLEDKLGYRFQPAFALPKMLWLKRHEPEVFARTRRFLHAADWLVGQLTGDFSRSDSSNALKSGFDLVDLRWPEWIEAELGLPLSRLPEVVSPGEPIGVVSAEAAEATGLRAGTLVIAGATDGTASFLASGAVAPGDWNSTLGTTLVVRGVSEKLVRDPLGRLYGHKHPEGYWLPGGASNVGGEWLTVKFPEADWATWDRQALNLVPTNLLVYPLVRRGERLPFVDGQAEGFVVGEPASQEELYAAHLEGVAFVERWIFELCESLGLAVGSPLYAAGGGARSEPWLRLRASVLRRTLVRPQVPEAAFGAAILAASRTYFEGLTAAVRALVRADLQVEPDPRLSRAFEARYERFREECTRRGYGTRV